MYIQYICNILPIVSIFSRESLQIARSHTVTSERASSKLLNRHSFVRTFFAIARKLTISRARSIHRKKVSNDILRNQRKIVHCYSRSHTHMTIHCRYIPLGTHYKAIKTKKRGGGGGGAKITFLPRSAATIVQYNFFSSLFCPLFLSHFFSLGIKDRPYTHTHARAHLITHDDDDSKVYI